jgi:hypothetical protein
VNVADDVERAGLALLVVPERLPATGKQWYSRARAIRDFRASDCTFVVSITVSFPETGVHHG